MCELWSTARQGLVEADRRPGTRAKVSGRGKGRGYDSRGAAISAGLTKPRGGQALAELEGARKRGKRTFKGQVGINQGGATSLQHSFPVCRLLTQL